MIPSTARPLVGLLLLVPALSAQTARGKELDSERLPRPAGFVLVSGYNSNSLHVYDVISGKPVKRIRRVRGAQSIVTGEDGLLYVCAEEANEILRIDPNALEVVDAFVFDHAGTPRDETGGLAGPTAAVFGPDKLLYVASFNGDSVLRYDGQTGVFLDVFVPPGSGGLNGPDAGMCFGPDGDLYVPSYESHAVLRYRGSNGAFRGAFVQANLGGLRNPRDLEFRGGLLHVSSYRSNRILSYDLVGNFVGELAIATRPTGFGFHPDTGRLYIASDQTNRVRIHDGETGAVLKNLFRAGAGGVRGATFLFFLP